MSSSRNLGALKTLSSFRTGQKPPVGDEVKKRLFPCAIITHDDLEATFITRSEYFLVTFGDTVQIDPHG